MNELVEQMDSSEFGSPWSIIFGSVTQLQQDLAVGVLSLELGLVVMQNISKGIKGGVKLPSNLLVSSKLFIFALIIIQSF